MRNKTHTKTNKRISYDRVVTNQSWQVYKNRWLVAQVRFGANKRTFRTKHTNFDYKTLKIYSSERTARDKPTGQSFSQNRAAKMGQVNRSVTRTLVCWARALHFVAKIK